MLEFPLTVALKHPETISFGGRPILPKDKPAPKPKRVSQRAEAAAAKAAAAKPAAAKPAAKNNPKRKAK